MRIRVNANKFELTDNLMYLIQVFKLSQSILLENDVLNKDKNDVAKALGRHFSEGRGVLLSELNEFISNE